MNENKTNKGRILLLNMPVKNIIIRIGLWSPIYWYSQFKWRGLLSWCFSYVNFKTTYFDYEGRTGKVDKPGFQVCIFGLQFGLIKEVNY